MEGELQERRLLPALRAIGRRRKTGILTIQGKDEIIAFSFSAGGIVGADALNQSLEDGLGGVLAGQQLIDPAEFASLVAEHEAGGGRVVDLLVERSLLSRGQLLESLRVHTYRLCLEALSWRTGEYRFYQGDEVAFESGVEPIGVGELLVRSSQDLAGAGLLPLPVPQPADVYSRTRETFADGAGEEVGSVVTESARRVLELIDGQRTIAEVAASSELAPFDVQELASEWSEAGIVEKTGRSEEVSSSASVGEVGAPSGDLQLAAVPEQTIGSTLDLPLDLEEPQAIETLHESSPPASVAPEPSASSRRPRIQVSDWVHRIFGLAVLVATLLLVVIAPARILLPFPWQGALREELRGAQRSVQRLKIERGAQTFFLVHGRYPESIGELHEQGQLLDDDLVTPEARPWRISANPASFVLSAPRATVGEEPSWTSSIAENFLLDPEYVRPESAQEGPLLILLD